jgi:hypothetical protein
MVSGGEKSDFPDGPDRCGLVGRRRLSRMRTARLLSRHGAPNTCIYSIVLLFTCEPVRTRVNIDLFDVLPVMSTCEEMREPVRSKRARDLL